ncbi:MAG: hypothetical protein ACPGXL_09700 [Chitinophagales bacterium]
MKRVHYLISIACLILHLECPQYLKAHPNSISDCSSLLTQYQEASSKHKVQDEIAFCKGVAEADTTKGLAQQLKTFQHYVDECTVYAYEREGIHMIYVGKLTRQSDIDKCKGFNYAMLQRIEAHLGARFYRFQNLIDDSYFGSRDILSPKFEKTLQEHVHISENFAGGIRIKLGKQDTIFPMFLNKMRISDRENPDVVFSFIDLYEGVNLPLDNLDVKDKQKVLRFNLDTFRDDKFCRPKNLPSTHVVRLDLTAYLNKWTEW